ncbi:protein arginine N-methyltransferase 9 [Spodoptera frugiperda]|uniref:Protein arginine N-methyltransferase 9 n=1 Tax=Spodoptera frugiperda TaxID=7108 RepID=A0A9R0CUD3_SPOFR|nr:protein arginine N-methyltransferase 9 [Spodoptera frugiperda]
MNQQGLEDIEMARQMTTNGCYNKAFDLYIMAFEKNVAIKSAYESEFRMVMTQLNEVLMTANKMEDVFINYTRALMTYPNSIIILNDMGKFLFKCGFYEKAWEHFEEALNLDYTFVNAEKNFNSLKNLLVERWHFRMLNDKVRNEAYRAAIHETVIPRVDTILDLGTGTGLLTVYASECSPRITTACDGSKVMSDLATAITQENGCEHCIIVNKLSTEMQLHEAGGKRTLLLTEVFDAGLFGEHVLQSLIHAWENMLTDNARVIPSKAEFFIIGAKCDFLHKRYQLCSPIKEILNVQNMNVHVLTFDETYDCEDVHFYGDDIKYMTEAKSLVCVDFNNCQELKNLIEMDHCEVEMVVQETGEINTVIGFFNLYLTDNVTITTDPRSDRRANAWQQAIFYDKIPVQVVENDIVPMYFSLNGGKLTMYKDDTIIRISPETIRFLNDIEYVNAIAACIGTTCIYLGQMAEMSQITVVDLSPFPVFGLHLLMRGAKSLTCCAKTDSDKEFFEIVFECNNVPLSNITILIGDEWTQEGFKDEKYHAIFCNIFEVCGEIDLRLKAMAEHLKQHHLIQEGLFLPASIKLMGQIVKSNWLDINNKLYDENVSNYKISKHLNPYQVTQNFCIDFSHLEYTPLSDVCVFGTSDSTEGVEVIDVPIIKDGLANAVLCWYIIELVQDLREVTTNRKNCFIDGIVFITDPKIRVYRGQSTPVLRSVDSDGAFKLTMHLEE